MENAIIMASGLGTRMRPLTNTVPKPLIKVHGIPMIETVIEGLLKRGVQNIYVVVGYLGDQFRYLEQKYGARLIWNHEFQTVNNISSVYAAGVVLKQGDCFICEADLYVPDSSLFERDLPVSGYFGKMVSGYSEDWVFEQDGEGYITRVGKGGADCYNMVGVAYFKQQDACMLDTYIKAAYTQQGYEDWFWDDVVNMHLNTLKLQIYPVKEGQIIEIDTVEELNVVNTKEKCFEYTR